ncbi:MAG: hypothetical protein ACYTFZ_01620 [Planctomycetota bacterium]|jgi:hypothetical protein
MARKAKVKRECVSRHSRLELIRQRHRKLILEPRAAIAADFGHEFEDRFDDILEADELEYAQAAATS